MLSHLQSEVHLDFEFKEVMEVNKAYSNKELGIQTFIIGLLFVIRVLTFLISNGNILNATKKVYYLKKILAIVWLRYLMIIIDQQQHIEYDIELESFWDKFYPTQDFTWYILIG